MTRMRKVQTKATNQTNDMTPTAFPEANTKFGPPPDMDETHVRTIPAFRGQIVGGAFDGSIIAIVAWKPSDEELKQLNAGKPIYLSTIGGLPAHYISMSFEEASNPA